MSTSPGPEPSRSDKAGAASAVYLYCLAWPQVAALSQKAGVDDCHPVETCIYRKLAAVVSQVAIDDFCGASAEARLRDLAWLGPRACRHEAVVEEAMRFSPVVPARFGTLFSSPETLAAFVRKRRPAIQRFLKRTTDKEEWVVKGLLDRKTAAEQLASLEGLALRPDPASVPPGTRFFRELRMLADAKQQVNIWLKKSCNELIKSLGYAPADVRPRRTLAAAAAENGLEVVLNCALLVPRSAVGKLRMEISRATARSTSSGLVFALSGPWPPYSFCPALSSDSQEDVSAIPQEAAAVPPVVPE